ncbi:hypothetical protein ANOM_004633 [Aspergillus nomiae NRRL 13137]|uniref:F-box domain protein n=1 Tax=Aspergillus nomiae NRRL (strain ATCC 15546 / NRRL 13137 / CBS 260.88 / M93) TaxID=1509407 RepID=A0A0L1J7X5_ASPN3|nr:uncharacterized protein ANOM_004633 [Aspergillus nomiae NRRL 13137]KNG87790.1 hypothetical protein ANOM_004633 [Aspergillus nomiae NRRL 13137]
MPSLLDLPLELRELIIELVLKDQRIPPAAPSQSNRGSFRDMGYRAWRQIIYYERRQSHCPYNASGLIRTNHQLSEETLATLDRISSSPYVLDVSVLNDVGLYPTWLSVPRLTHRVSTLHVNVRLFGHILSRDSARSQVGDGGHLGFQWSFYALLERFIRYGPVDGKTSREEDPMYIHRDMTVKTLVLDFQSAESGLFFPPDEVDYRWWWRRIIGWILFLEPRLESLLSCLIIDPTRMVRKIPVRILYERIGTIKVLVNGEPNAEIDLAGPLARLHFTDTRDVLGYAYTESELAAYREWKKETLARREQLGFRVVWLHDPEFA